MNTFLNAMKFRHACKIFDENKKIPKHQFDDILESGRLSPSSMGVEPTRMLIIKSNEIKQQLRKSCWNQAQLTTASEVVVLKCLLQSITPPSNYINAMSARRGKNDEEKAKWIRFYGRFLQKREDKGISIRHWVEKQSYIMASSMMNCAAYMGIDSCAIEGFEEEEINQILQIDTFKECVSLILTFGYRIKEQQKRYRLKLEDLIEYR